MGRSKVNRPDRIADNVRLAQEAPKFNADSDRLAHDAPKSGDRDN
jgi:hypothetical protein